MNTLRKHLVAFGCLLASVAMPAAPQPAPYALQWDVHSSVIKPGSHHARSLATMSLANRSGRTLGATGWALYFNCISGVVEGPAEPSLVVDRLAGTLYRVRPAAGFEPVPSGATLKIALLHHELMFRADKSPRGPYLVFDEQPDVAIAITDYQLLTPTRPEQLQVPAGAPSPVVTAQELFDRHAAVATLPLKALPPVFPTPLQVRSGSGALRLSAMPVLRAGQGLKHEAAIARALLAPHFEPGTAGRGVLTLAVGRVAGQASPEAYTLDVHAKTGIHIVGNSAAGVAHGLKSLRDLLPVAAQPSATLQLPALHITDAPRFEYRGLLMDVARSFQPKETVLRVLDLMARYKLNKLHFHVTDDEGWRVPIPGLPELTDFGARRGHTADPQRHLPPAYGSGPDPSTAPGSGHYSRADYIAILRHAQALHIEVIPEIEMPGHARAAVKAMEVRVQRLQQAGVPAGDPQATRYLLSDPADQSQYRSPQLYTDHVMNPGMPGTYAFIDHVVAELVALHREAGVPLKTLHVGADEAPAGAWEKSPAAAAAIRQHGLKDVAGLWNHFYGRVAATLQQHGLRMAGWEELGALRAQVNGQSRLVPNPVFRASQPLLYVWNNLDDNVDLAYRLANAGYDTVLAPATALYFDMAHNRSPDEVGVNWAAYVDLDTVFNFVPLDSLRSAPTVADPDPAKVRLAPAARHRIRGMQATMFSEVLRNREKIEFMLMPRLLGLAERAWAADPAWATETDAARAKALHAQAWSVFANQVGQQVLPRLDADLSGAAAVGYRIPPPGLQSAGSQVQANAAWPGNTIRYTTDGSEPTATSTLVGGPIAATGAIRAAVFTPLGRRSASTLLAAP